MAGFLDTPIAGPLTLRKVGKGLREAVGAPLVSDIQQGNTAIKQLRDEHPTADAFAGIYPPVAVAQVANDVLADQIGADTGGNVLQAIPMVKKVNRLHKGLRVGGYGYDPRATITKNALITQAQVLGQTGNVE